VRWGSQASFRGSASTHLRSVAYLPHAVNVGKCGCRLPLVDRVGQDDLGLCVVCMVVHRVCWWACGGQQAETACGWADLWDGETEWHGGVEIETRQWGARPSSVYPIKEQLAIKRPQSGLPAAGAVLWWRRPSPGVGTRTSSRRDTGIPLVLHHSTAPAHEGL
jgi:hypothetical protein